MAYPDGGLYNPVALTFDPSFNSLDFSKPIKHFKYPVLEDVKRPESDDDLAFMKVMAIHPLYLLSKLDSFLLSKVGGQQGWKIPVYYTYFLTSTRIPHN